MKPKGRLNIIGVKRFLSTAQWRLRTRFFGVHETTIVTRNAMRHDVREKGSGFRLSADRVRFSHFVASRARRYGRRRRRRVCTAHVCVRAYTLPPVPPPRPAVHARTRIGTHTNTAIHQRAPNRSQAARRLLSTESRPRRTPSASRGPSAPPTG